MTIKEKVLQAVKDLPDAVIEDAMERLYFMAKIEKGIEQAEAGQTIVHDDETPEHVRSINFKS